MPKKQVTEKIREWAQRSGFIVDMHYFPEADRFLVETDGGRATATGSTLDEAWANLKKPSDSSKKKKKKSKKKEAAVK